MSRRFFAALVVLTLGAFALGTSVLGVRVEAQPVAPRADSLKQADELFAKDHLQEAEKAYLRLLDLGPAEMRGACFDRLLSIYGRWGRHDLAVQTGLRYHAELVAAKDTKRLSRLRHEIGAGLYQLGHYERAEKFLSEALADGARLDALEHLQATRVLAQTLEQLDRDADARKAWEKLEEEARTALDQGRLASSDATPLEWTLAEREISQGKSEAAVDRLTRLLAKRELRNDLEARSETLYRRAQARGPKSTEAATEQDLHEALVLQRKLTIANPLMEGDLHAALAGLYHRRKDATQVEAERKHAAEAYTIVLKNPVQGPAGASGTVAAFWKLQRLYQTSAQFTKALQLAASQKESWGVDHLLEARWKADFGGVALHTGQYAEALPSLRDAARLLEAQSPTNLKDLPLVLLHLAGAELASGDPAGARARAERVLEVYRTNKLRADPVLVEAYHLVGSAAAQTGQFVQAFEAYREGTDLCAKLGAAADPALSLLLLQTALTYQAQGELNEALRACQEARTVCERFADPDSPSFLAFDAAQANLCLNQGKLKEAIELSSRLIELGKKHGLDRGPFLITAMHCQALDLLARKQFDQAEEVWRGVLARQEASKQLSMTPRTWNYLALCAEMRGDFAEAEKRYREALARQKKSPQSFPATHFITLWRLANVVDKQGRGAEARTLLEEGLAVVEKTRLTTFGDARQRAAFFAQFSPGIDQLVEWNLRDRDWRAAFAAMARGRSRTLMDQMMLCGVDPREHLQGPRGQALAKRETELEKQVATLRMRALSLPPGDGQAAEAEKLMSEFDVALRDYADVRREIFAASPVYRNLTDKLDPGDTLQAIQEKVLGSKRLLLNYYIGQQHSYLVILGAPTRGPAVIPLKVSETIARNIAIPEPPSLAVALEGSKGLRGLQVQANRPAPVDAPPPTLSVGASQALSNHTARALVDHYLQHIADPTFNSTRGLSVIAKEPTRKLAIQRAELLGEVFVPPAARRLIRESGAEVVLVIPDGPLHKLPLETLLLASDDGPRYLLEELPPVIYVPSTGVLAHLADRPKGIAEQLSLLTVGNPDYPQAEPGAKVPQVRGMGSFVVGFRGQLPLLEGSARESTVVTKFFDQNRVLSLTGRDATEKAVVEAMRQRQVIHIAAHGFADDRFGNLFGAIALTPPAKVTSADDDGFLSLHEIYQLPLGNCELAVLSACQTNVGPQQPLESGVTLANGFLAAGARRVVASHWSVDDASTAALMETFFEELTRTHRTTGRFDAPQALRAARLRVRNHSQWASPFYWGPFVVMGSPF
jgi:CHAT domain-containing protein